MDEILIPMQEVMLEFRAGKMSTDGTRVIPDTRKGLFRIARGEEGLVHFQWIDRTQNVIEDDQIVFPDEASFEKVNQSSGRVYVLKFNTDNRRFFFWMQLLAMLSEYSELLLQISKSMDSDSLAWKTLRYKEPSAGSDTDLCNLVNYHINHPLEFDGEEELGASLPQQMEMLDDMPEDETSTRAENLVGANLGAEGISDVTSSGPVKLADLQRILSSLGPTDGEEDPDAGDILKPDLILPLLGTLPLEQRLASYLPEPEGQWTPEDLMELLQSPPFRQQVEAFTYVLRTGEIDLSQFGIDPSKYKLTVLSFLEALDDSVAKVPDSDDAMDEGH
ncbi:hypothetical protein GIB67_043191 [Kingdonia uniflora]|uniref:Regulatory particle non-ATPase 13 n=1 Tax=Kingdonia uniflora TaxID=39325 RepID=A0A7J7NK12_9MAGN|nr:hypothetical protein GIB67_043191 [Kingdonia uniflora]